MTCFRCGVEIFKKRSKKNLRNFCSHSCCKDQFQQEKSDGYTVIRHAYKKAEHRARRSRLEFTITLEYVHAVWKWQNGICSLSGLPISFASTKSAKRSGVNTASIDRIDSSKGYIPGNIQFIHKDIQTMKWSMHEDKFIRLCRLIAEHTQGRKLENSGVAGVDMTDTSGTLAVEAMNAPRFDSASHAIFF